jgi:hypothetical protein
MTGMSSLTKMEGGRRVVVAAIAAAAISAAAVDVAAPEVLAVLEEPEALPSSRRIRPVILLRAFLPASTTTQRPKSSQIQVPL